MITLEKNLAVQPAAIRLQDIHVDNSPAAFDKLRACAEEYRQKYPGTAISEIPGVHWGRELFHAIGIDPTKRRPSSEALLHRALKGKELYSVNSLVDVGNWCSLDFLLPICVYDAEKIKGDTHLRLGKPGESYLALTGQEIHLSDRYVLADSLGAFGSPITDSQRTAVDEHTRQALLILFAPLSYSPQSLSRQAHLFADRATAVCGGKMAFCELPAKPFIGDQG